MEQIKLTISRKVLEALQDLSDKRGESISETLRHAINTETYITENLEKGNIFLVKDHKGSFWKVVFSHIK